jgi:hypothetical protein
MARQVRLTHSHPLRLHVIIETSVLVRPFGDAHAQVRQLRHLADLATHSNISIQVLPIEVGLHRALYSPFATLEFRDRTRLVHLEAATAGIFLDEDEHVEAYTHIWNQLTALAYNVEKSVDFISAIANQMHERNWNNIIMITTSALSAVSWRKSSRSGGTSNCVEVATTGKFIAIRDSKNPMGYVLILTPIEWKNFLTIIQDFR